MADPRRPARQGMLQGVLATLIAEGLALPVGLITATILTRWLGPESYGHFTVTATTLAITEWLLIAILARAVVQFVAEAADWHAVAATAFRVYVGTGLAIGLLFWLLAGPFAAALNDPQLASYLRLFAIQIPLFAAGAASRSILAGQARFRQQAAAVAAGWCARAVFVAGFVIMGWGIRGAILGSIFGTAAGTAISVVLVGGAVWGPARFPARKLLHLAVPTFAAMLSARLLDQIGIWVLQAVGDQQAEVGFYGAAMNVLMITGVVAAAVAPVLISGLTAARHSNDEPAVHRLSTGAIRFGLALFPFAAIVAGSAGEIVALLFGPEFAPAAPLVALLIFAAIARANMAVVSALLIGLGRAWTAALIALPLPLLAAVVHARVVPRSGAAGAATVTLAFGILGAVLSMVAVVAVGASETPVRTVFRSAALSAVVYAAAVLVPAPGMAVVAKGAVLTLVALGGFVIAGELTREEFDGIRAAVLSRQGG